MAVKSRGITYSELFAKSDRRIIQDIVNDQIKVIDAKISIAHGSGFSEITYELPINFNINNMSKSDAQTLIYSEILMAYKLPEPNGKGFGNVTIDMGMKSIIRIGWINGMDAEERERRNKYIKECMHGKK